MHITTGVCFKMDARRESFRVAFSGSIFWRIPRLQSLLQLTTIIMERRRATRSNKRHRKNTFPPWFRITWSTVRNHPKRNGAGGVHPLTSAFRQPASAPNALRCKRVLRNGDAPTKLSEHCRGLTASKTIETDRCMRVLDDLFQENSEDTPPEVVRMTSI